MRERCFSQPTGYWFSTLLAFRPLGTAFQESALLHCTLSRVFRKLYEHAFDDDDRAFQTGSTFFFLKNTSLPPKKGGVRKDGETGERRGAGELYKGGFCLTGATSCS